MYNNLARLFLHIKFIPAIYNYYCILDIKDNSTIMTV